MDTTRKARPRGAMMALCVVMRYKQPPFRLCPPAVPPPPATHTHPSLAGHQEARNLEDIRIFSPQTWRFQPRLPLKHQSILDLTLSTISLWFKILSCQLVRGLGFFLQRQRVSPSTLHFGSTPLITGISALTASAGWSSLHQSGLAYLNSMDACASH